MNSNDNANWSKSLLWSIGIENGVEIKIGRNHQNQKLIEIQTDSEFEKLFYYKDEKLVKYQIKKLNGEIIENHLFLISGEEIESYIYSNGFLVQSKLLDKNSNTVEIVKRNNSGHIIEIVHFRNNLKHGVWKKFDKNTGNIEFIKTFFDDELNGISKEYFKTHGAVGNIKKIAYYSMGKLHGKYQEYLKSGMLIESGIYLYGKREGLYFKYFESGALKLKYEYYNGELNGFCYDYFQNGKVRKLIPYRNGKVHGVEKYFNEFGQLTHKAGKDNGKLSEEILSKESVNKGVWIDEWFFNNGNVAKKVSYLNDVKHGPYEYFFENGLTKEVGQFVNDQKNGEISFFNLNGLKIEIANYKDGKRHGERLLYFKSGVIKEKELWESNQLAKKSKYFENSSIQEIYTFIERDLFHYEQYFEDGVLKAEGFQIGSAFDFNGFLHGEQKYYNHLGSLNLKSNYQKGLLHGESEYFNDVGELISKTFYDQGTLLERWTFDVKLRCKEFYFSDGSIKEKIDFSDESPEKLELVNTNKTPPPIPIHLKKNVSNFEIGNVVGNKYKILRPLGHGGMSDVYLAHDLQLDRKIAIKIIKGELNEESLKRFESEGRALAKISHPNVISVLEINTDLNMPYLVMEYLKGWTLTTLIGPGILNIKEQIKIFRQLALGLQEAHQNLILHRDLKPSNIVITKDLFLKIIDFGISWILDDTNRFQTEENVIVGTLKYLPPEIALGSSASIQSDIYSLGVVFYEVLTGKVPFQGLTQFDTLEKIKNEELNFPTEFDNFLPDQIIKIIKKMTLKNPDERYTHCSEIIKELDLVSFEYLPEDFFISIPYGLEVSNSDEVRSSLKDNGRSESEISLILNLAMRIQTRILSKVESKDKTENILLTDTNVLFLSPEALAEATIRYESALKEKNARSL